MKPAYATKCAARCMDRRGNLRDGDQWVHLHGLTYWMCASCAEHHARLHGIPTRAQVRRDTRVREARMQLSLLAEDPQRTSKLS